MFCVGGGGRPLNKHFSCTLSCGLAVLCWGGGGRETTQSASKLYIEVRLVCFVQGE